ncbi:MAG: hypothetical protein COB62_01195 [Piscirickettsiaceae bacterium]|nr:MAG: hypothetical protein COB62_01195 [Piscirickettsiaceae bacterium]
MNIKTTFLSLSTGVMLLALTAPAHAAFSWKFNNSPASTGTPNGTSITATASAWASSSTASNGGAGNLQSANLNQFNGGLGVSPSGIGESAPNHATDNDGRKESILFSFSQSIALTSIYMGYVSGDADFSLLRYTGAGGPNLASNSYGTLQSNGWELVSDVYYNGGYIDSSNTNTGRTANDINTGMLTSSYWLVAAANTAFGFGSAWVGNDYFKLKKVYGKTVTPPSTGVPSPNTLPLLAIALLGMGWANRRKKV